MGSTGTKLLLAGLLGAALAAGAQAQSNAPAAPAGGAAAQPGAAGTTAGCTKAEFEDVVDEAAAALRDLNAKNKPDFQEKLRQLKDKRGWTHDQFLTEAAPYVRDDKIAVYDQEFGAALERHLLAR